MENAVRETISIIFRAHNVEHHTWRSVQWIRLESLLEKTIKTFILLSHCAFRIQKKNNSRDSFPVKLFFSLLLENVTRQTTHLSHLPPPLPESLKLFKRLSNGEHNQTNGETTEQVNFKVKQEIVFYSISIFHFFPFSEHLLRLWRKFFQIFNIKQ